MQDLHELAIEAIEARQQGSSRFSQIIDEMQASGLSHKRIREMLEQAECIVCPQSAISMAKTH